MTIQTAKRDWVPLERFGEYRFGQAVVPAMHLQTVDSESDEYWEAYKEQDTDDIRVYTENGLITCVGAYEYFYFEGRNLIGLPFTEVLKLLDTQYDHTEVQEVLDESQTVYRFDALSLVVWAQGERVVTVQCGERVDD